MDLTIPTISSDEFVTLFKQKTEEVSEGRLTDFSEGSTLLTLGEAMALSYATVSSYLEQVFPELLARSWELLGYERSPGAQALTTVRILLNEVLPNDFYLPVKYRFAVKGVMFETRSQLLIPSGVDTSSSTNYPQAQVEAIAVEIGDNANFPAQQATIVNEVAGLAALYIEDSVGGVTGETAEQYRNRIAATLIDAVGTDDRPVVTPSDFVRDAQAILGDGSIAIAVPEVDSNGAQQVAAMAVFVSPSSPAQLTELQNQISTRAPLAKGRLSFQPLPVQTVNVQASAIIAPTNAPDTVASGINAAIRGAVNPASTLAVDSVDVYAAVTAMYGVEGVQSGEISWAFEGDPLMQSLRLTLPKLASSAPQTSVAQIGTITVTFSSGLTRTFSS